MTQVRKMPVYAPKGWRWYRVQTPSVFREMMLPDTDYNEMKPTYQHCYDKLSEIASRHGTYVQSSPYRCG